MKTESNFEDMRRRWVQWYEHPETDELGWESVMRYRTEAHAWITELRAYQAQPDREYCMCNALEAAIEEFTWSQALLNKVGPNG